MPNDVNSYLQSLFSMEGKIAVMIGGTGVLVGKMAEGLYRAGATVVLVGRSHEKADTHFEQWAKSAPARVHFEGADVSKPEALQQVLDKTLNHFGKIDVWVNGAGINAPTPYRKITESEFQDIVNINISAVHRGCQAVIKHWLDNKSAGNIINVSSMSAIRAISRVFTYSLTKAAVWNLTQNLAREYATKGIRINALCPGFFPAEQNRSILDAERVASIMAHTPMKRFGNPEELIGATLLLASNSAGSFITGCHLVVDGGFNVVSI